MFDVGQKVVCVDGTFPHAVLNYMRNLPKQGNIYTVRDVIPAREWPKAAGQMGACTCGILLKECANAPAPHRKEWGECGFAPHRFRELTPDEAAMMAHCEKLGIADNVISIES